MQYKLLGYRYGYKDIDKDMKKITGKCLSLQSKSEYYRIKADLYLKDIRKDGYAVQTLRI